MAKEGVKKIISPQKINPFVFRRYAQFFRKLSWPLKLGTMSLSVLLDYGVIEDTIRGGDKFLITGSVIIMLLFNFALFEGVALFEFRAVELIDYGSNDAAKLRDDRLGRFSIRLILIIGNLVLISDLIKRL